MRRLTGQRASTPPDARPALLSVIALMLLLLPFLLLTTSVHKLTATNLRLPGEGESLPPVPPGAVERLAVEVQADGSVRVVADVRQTDVTAKAGDAFRRVTTVASRDGGVDYPALQVALQEIKAQDPARTRLRLAPAEDVRTRVMVALMDAVRSADGKALFPDVVLDAPEAPAEIPVEPTAEEAP